MTTEEWIARELAKAPAPSALAEAQRRLAPKIRKAKEKAQSEKAA